VTDDEFDAAFEALLARAREVARWVASSLPDSAGDQMPEATVRRVMLSAEALYHAAVASLAEPETAMGSLVLLRSLIEAFGYLWFIAGDDDQASAECRAIRVELAWANNMLGLAKGAGSAMADQLSAAEARVELIDSLHVRNRDAAYGCKHVDARISESLRSAALNIRRSATAPRALQITGCVGRRSRGPRPSAEFQTSLRRSCRSATSVCEVKLSAPDLQSVSSASIQSVAYDPVVGMKIGMPTRDLRVHLRTAGVGMPSVHRPVMMRRGRRRRRARHG
jgi:hypothetical protein